MELRLCPIQLRGHRRLHPLSLADGITPVPDSVTGASTSSHPPSAADGPASVHDPTAVGSTTTTQYTAVTYDMVSKDLKFYQNPTVQKAAALTFVGAFIACLVMASAKHKDDLPWWVRFCLILQYD